MSETHHHPVTHHLRGDLTMFFGIFAVVLTGVIGLYIYDLRTGVLSQFAGTLFHWLID